MRHRAISAHEMLLAHPWAAMQITSRLSIGPGMTRYLDATLGRLREGGFSIEGALDAWNTLDSHLYGFTPATTCRRGRCRGSRRCAR